MYNKLDTAELKQYEIDNEAHFVEAYKEVEYYYKEVMNNPMALKMIKDGGIKGTGVFIHALTSIKYLKQDGILENKEEIQRRFVEGRRNGDGNLYKFYLRAFEAELNYIQRKAERKFNLPLTLWQVADAVYKISASAMFKEMNFDILRDLELLEMKPRSGMVASSLINSLL